MNQFFLNYLPKFENAFRPFIKNLKKIRQKCQRFTATHMAKSHKPKLKPKLGKECVCPTAQPTDKQGERQKGSS
jgi:hypothetical protein